MADPGAGQFLQSAGSPENASRLAAASANGAVQLSRLKTYDGFDPPVPQEACTADEPVKIPVPGGQAETPTAAQKRKMQQPQAPLGPADPAFYGGMYPGQMPYPGGMPFPMGPGMMPPYMWMAGGMPPYGPYGMMPGPGMFPGACGMVHPDQGYHAMGRHQQAAEKPKRDRHRRGKKNKGKGDDDGGGSPQADGDDANAARSPELIEVRKHHMKCKLTLEKILPNLQEFALDQQGCRFLVAKLDDATPEEKQQVFDAILPEAGKLASDAFANFVVQKLFEIATPKQQSDLVHELRDDILRLCKETHGCRVVQTAIHNLWREPLQMIAKELEKDVFGCIENPHGNHVIQKFIEQMSPVSLQFIISQIENNIQRMAKHMYGCRIIQRLIEHSSADLLCTTLENIMAEVPLLAQDGYGNYVIQHMLDHGRMEDKRNIIMEVAENVAEFSVMKHASNVVEKCFEIATQGEHAESLEKERAALFESVLGSPGEVGPLHNIMSDKYGNYIVQRMIEYSARIPERDQLKACLSHPQVYEQLSTSSTGPYKHIYNAYLKFFEEK